MARVEVTKGSNLYFDFDRSSVANTIINARYLFEEDGLLDDSVPSPQPDKQLKVASYNPTRLSLDQIAQAFNKNNSKPKKD